VALFSLLRLVSPSCVLWRLSGRSCWRRSGCRLVLCPGLAGRGWCGFSCRPAVPRRWLWASFVRPVLLRLGVVLAGVVLLPVLVLAAVLVLASVPFFLVSAFESVLSAPGPSV